MITYICAWLRCYYPLEFTTAYFKNAANKDDILMGNELIKTYQFNVKDIRFRYSRKDYFFDKPTNTIYKGIGHLKNMGVDDTNTLDRLGNIVKGNSFADFIVEYDKEKGLSKSNVATLIALDYFSDFGKSKKLLTMFAYSCIMQCKDISKDKEYPYPVEVLSQFCERETNKKYVGFNREKFLRYIESRIEDDELPISEKMFAQLEYTGSIYYTNPEMANLYVVTDYKEYGKHQVYIELYSVGKGETFKSKVMNPVNLVLSPLNKHSIIIATSIKNEFIKQWNEEKKQLVRTDRRRNNLYGWKTVSSLSDPVKKFKATIDEYKEKNKKKKVM